ncbi:MAG: alpha/beta hydrolase [Clostridia bacterium]|nr:alpha/beta hydrolase [Clostridia bacterium]
MAKVTKILGTTAKAAAIAAGAYLAAGAVVYEGALGRWGYINSKPEESLNEPGNMHKYLTLEEFRKSDDWYMANRPEDTRLINGKGETLHADIIPATEESHKWCVALHGYSSQPRCIARQARPFHEKGYNVLMPYMRGHRKSEQKHCTMGYFDRYDAIAWINYIVSMDPDAVIVIIGESMGAATTMLVTGEELPDNVKCAIADCGYTNCYEQCAGQISNLLHLPEFPFMPAANTYSKLFYGWDMKKCSPVDAVANSKTPTLFIHGEKDDFVPYRMMNVVYDACAAEKDLLSVPDAEHAESVDVHPELYWPKVWEFVDKYVKD